MGKSLLVIVPALNEEMTIATVLQAVPRRIGPIDSVSLLVVDDGSTDRTAELARENGAHVISHSRNLGVGRALRSGMDYAITRHFDYVAHIDGDGQFNPADIAVLLAPIIEDRCDFVTASRFLDPALVPKMPRVKIFGNRMLARLVSRLTGVRLRDVSCGFRAYRWDTVLRLVLTGRYTYTHEALLYLIYREQRVMEIPVKVRGEREFGKSRVAGNLFRYGYQAASIIAGFVRDIRPTAFFGGLSLGFFVPGLLLALFFIGHRLSAGTFSPHLWAGFLSAFTMGLGVIVVIFGQLAAMLSRLRLIQEEQLYLLRRSSVTDAP